MISSNQIMLCEGFDFDSWPLIIEGLQGQIQVRELIGGTTVRVKTEDIKIFG